LWRRFRALTRPGFALATLSRDPGEGLCRKPEFQR
jgi:hypothetical protein